MYGLFSKILFLSFVVFKANANNTWDERISIDGYGFRPICSYGFPLRDYLGSGNRNEAKEIRRYEFHLRNDSSLFENYERTGYNIQISTSKYNFKGSVYLHSTVEEDRLKSKNNKMDFYFYIYEDDLNKALSSPSMKVYLPRGIFSHDLTGKLYRKHLNLRYNYLRNDLINYYVSLSTEGLGRYKSECSMQVKKSKIKFNVEQKEKNRPINKLKRFFEG